MFGKQIFRGDFWLKGKGRYIIASSLIVLVLLGVTQVFIPTGDGQENVGDRAYWLRLANNAWNFFQPGIGVESATGLHSAGLGYHYFTDWDLGVYIQATIDVSKLGILVKTGTYGADWRFDKVLTFLETRELAWNGAPYAWYDPNNGQRYGDGLQNACDAGKLLMALQNLRVYRSDLASRINNIVYTRTNYAPHQQEVDGLTGRVNIYDYYVASGFAGFWPDRFNSVANAAIASISSASTVTSNGVKLPVSILNGEGVLHSVFELAPNAKLTQLAQTFYSAHEARYIATDKFVAFSEGNTGLDNPSYIYEWVVYSDGRTWIIKNPSESDVSFTPIVYFKTAVGLLALNSTDFTRNMVSFVSSRLPSPTYGYQDGVDDNGRIVTTTTDKTNGLIIEAARYAINNLPVPTPVPTSPPIIIYPSPVATPTPTVNPTPTPAPTATPSPVVTPSPSPFPSPTVSPSPTATFFPSPTVSPSPVVSPSISPSPSPSPSLSASPSSSSSPSPNPIVSPSPSATISYPVSPSPAVSSSPSPFTSIVPSSSVSPSVSSDSGTSSSGNWLLGPAVIISLGVVSVVLVSLLLVVRFRKK